MVHTHADFLDLPLTVKPKEQKGLTEAELYKNLETYLNYNLLDSDHAESWRLRSQAETSSEKLKAATEGLVHSISRSGGLLGNVFGAAAAPAGSLKEAGQKLTKDLLAAGYSETKTATILYSIASSGVGPISSLVGSEIYPIAQVLTNL